MQIYRGVWQADHEYSEGDTVTHGGGQWCAKRKTTARPPAMTGNCACKPGRQAPRARMENAGHKAHPDRNWPRSYPARSGWAQMGLKLITAPSILPVTVAEAKLHLRVDHSEEDDLIERAISSATGFVDGPDGFLGRALIDQTWELTLDEFPVNEIRIPLPPLIEVVSVVYDDADGNPQTIATRNIPSTMSASRAGSCRCRRVAGRPYSRVSTRCASVSGRATWICRNRRPWAKCPPRSSTRSCCYVGDQYANRENIIIGVSRHGNENIGKPAAAATQRHQSGIGATMKVKALQPIYYGGQQYAPGDEYEMDDRDGQEAATLVALGKIEILPKQSQWNVMPGEEAEPIPVKGTTQVARAGHDNREHHAKGNRRQMIPYIPEGHAEGNAEVVAFLERWLARAKLGGLNYVAGAFAEGPIHVYHDFAGCRGMEFAANWGLDVVKSRIMNAQQTLEPPTVDETAPANRFIWLATRGASVLRFLPLADHGRDDAHAGECTGAAAGRFLLGQGWRQGTHP